MSRRVANNQRRIRIDSIINAIKKGEYDDRLSDIETAITERNVERQMHVLALVKEVYGNDFTVTKPGENRNPFIEKEQERRAAADPPPAPEPAPPAEPAPGEAPTPPDPLPPELLDLNAVSDREREMEAEIERRGASIGSPEGPLLGPGDLA